MSASVATRRLARRTARLALVVCALTGGALAADEPAKQPTDPNAVKKLDAKAPLPADRPGRAAHDKFAVPGQDRAMFAKIEDFKPVAAQDQNRAEYDAWCEVVSHATKFSAAELEAHAARDITVIELRKSLRSTFRTELVRFDGQVVCARRLDAPKFFLDNPDSGLKELYEVRLIPDGASPLEPISVVFTELPAALAAVKDKPMRMDDKGESLGVGEWVAFDDKDGKYAGPKVWASAAGYYFKLMSVPGEEANSVVSVPVLIGKSVTPLAGPPAPTGADPTAIDTKLRIWKHIKDEAPLFHDLETQMELAAYTRVLIHANRFTPEQIEERADKEVKFASLFLDTRATYRLRAVRFEGRLIALSKKEPNAEMKAAGIGQVFEGWLVPANEPRGNPVRIDFTEPLDGVPVGGRVNKWVSFGGFSFKKMLYESAEADPNKPGKNLFKFAPLLLGKSPIARRDPDAPDNVTWPTFVLWAIAGGVALIASAGVLTWYYRGGDRQAKREMDAVRGKNPFDAAGGPGATNTTNPPDGPVRPSGEW
jgi:hypothetical protein